MKYGFIGCGNMGGAIAKALAKTTNDIMITDRSGKAKALAEELFCTYADPVTVAASCERIFLAVKPQMMSQAIAPVQKILKEKKPLLVTMAAGLTIERIQELAGCELPVIRIMPNPPVLVGKGMTLYCYNDLVDDAVLEDFLDDMAFTGHMDEITEHLIDSAGVVSGCGPAYMYMFAEALADGAVACGVPRAKALEYAAATLAGAGEMLLQSGEHPGKLKDNVCSPGGSTIAGVNILEQRAFRGAVIDCVKAAYKRNQELGK